MSEALIPVRYGARVDPSLRCGECGKVYYLPQTVRWDREALLKCKAEAIELCWLISDEGKVRCPDHWCSDTYYVLEYGQCTVCGGEHI